MPSPSGIRKDSSIFAFGDGGGMPPPYKDVSHINNYHLQFTCLIFPFLGIMPLYPLKKGES